MSNWHLQENTENEERGKMSHRHLQENTENATSPKPSTLAAHLNQIQEHRKVYKLKL